MNPNIMGIFDSMDRLLVSGVSTGCGCYGYLFVQWAQHNVCGWVQVVSQRADLFSISIVCSLPRWRSERKLKYVIHTE